MKLNNNGWGTKELIISGCIIILLLLIIVFNIQRLYNNLEESMNNNNNNNRTTIKEPKDEDDLEIVVEDSNDNNTNDTNSTNNDDESGNYDVGSIDLAYYNNYEERMKTAAKNYIIATDYPVTSSESVIELSTIVNNNYINSLVDINDNSLCNGYVNVVLGTQYNIIITPYISCTSYTTEGY